MKRISVHDSRRNSARRKRKVAARHARAGHWQAQRRPMFSPGKVHYEVGAYTDAMSYGGIGAVHRLVTKLGLPKRIDASLDRCVHHTSDRLYGYSIYHSDHDKHGLKDHPNRQFHVNRHQRFATNTDRRGANETRLF